MALSKLYCRGLSKNTGWRDVSIRILASCSQPRLAGCSHHGKASRKAIDLEPMEFGELLWHVKIPMGPRMEQTGGSPDCSGV
jgi:hypothetical protein